NQSLDPIDQVARRRQNAIDVGFEVVAAVPRRFDVHIFCIDGDDANSRQHLLARALHTRRGLQISLIGAHGLAMLRRRTRGLSTSASAASIDLRLVSSFWMR